MTQFIDDLLKQARKDLKRGDYKKLKQTLLRYCDICDKTVSIYNKAHQVNCEKRQLLKLYNQRWLEYEKLKSLQ